MKRCPFCAEEIQDAAIVCRYCGRDLGWRRWIGDKTIHIVLMLVTAGVILAILVRLFSRIARALP